MMIESLISMVRYLSARKDDDFADRMNYLYTPNILLAFSVLISFKQFGGRPLECMFPNKFPGSWEQYAENFCWSEDTYYLPPEVHVAQIHESERYSSGRKLSYYQWVPFFLLFQAACFRFPSLIWKAINLSSGLRVHDVVTKALDSQNMEETSRRRTLQILANHLARALSFQSQIMRRHLIVHETFRLFNVTCASCFITLAYLVIKLLYLGNVFAQLFIMNKFLETDRYNWYGLSVFVDIMAGIPWQTSGYFPRVSLCDFTVRQVANIQKYSVQCVLVINIFNEKIFILLWFWYGILLLVTSVSLVYWLTMLIFPQFGRWYVAQALELRHIYPKVLPPPKHIGKNEKKNIRRFVDEFLKSDGVFALRMLGLHTGILFTSELVSELYGLHEEMLQCDSSTFSEDTTLKVEDAGGGGGVPTPFGQLGKKGKEASVKQQQQQHQNNNKQTNGKRQDKLKASAADEMITSLIPVVNDAGNRSESSSSSSASSSDQQQNNNQSQ
uniref:Innexin n=1 Tax=Globodera pallida TaxID=36090 RepID=A0A183BYW5_GLOPA